MTVKDSYKNFNRRKKEVGTARDLETNDALYKNRFYKVGSIIEVF